VVAGPSTTWNIEISFSEDVNHTDAVAVLRTPDNRVHRGHGQARRNPADRPAPLIGEEVASARALSNLAHELLESAATQIEANVQGRDPAA
jgi:hypothetical protein